MHSDAQAHIEERSSDHPGRVLDIAALAPWALGGVVLHGLPGPGRDAALERLREMLPARVRVPVNTSEDRLLGGLDMAATLRSAQPVYETGLLKSAHRGVLVLSMAERLSGRFVALICQTLDTQQLIVERDGQSTSTACAPMVVALDESLEDDERIAASLEDRLAFRLSTDFLDRRELADYVSVVADVGLATLRERYRRIDVSDDMVAALSRAALSLGIVSLRPALQAIATARALAALDNVSAVTEAHVGQACRLVYTHRVRQLPPSPERPADRQERAPESSAQHDSDVPDPPEDEPAADGAAQALRDTVVQAVQAALPEHVLKMLASGGLAASKRAGRGASAGVATVGRGRPIGVRAVPQLGRQTLNVLATVKAAAPWQRLRGATGRRLRIVPDDFRVTRFKPKTRTTTVFVVDASGSSAARRLAEVKGAVELLLAECYVTRARVAVIAFRGERAELLLAPTRSLTRARRQLADLPGGGATPLADAIDVTRELCVQLQRQAEQAQVIFLTDGHGNVGRDGQPGHPDAVEHAHSAAREFELLRVPSLLVDTSRRPRDRARRMADAMGARYLPLPYADAGALAQAVTRAA